MFYDRLKETCEIKGFKLTPLIKELGMSQGNMSRWKKGGKPTVEVVNALSERLEISVDYLLGNTDDPTPANKKKAAPDGEQPSEVIAGAEALRIYAEGKKGGPLTQDELRNIDEFMDIYIKGLDK